MHAVNLIRSRQEERELDYWLSIVAFERQDRSLLNRLYLLYLFIFFAIWVFVMLTFFASGGALILQLASPFHPSLVVVSVELSLLGVWSIYGLWQACRRSPVVFSEADEVLICHTPVDRRLVTSRWFIMPWLKSAVAFWVIAVILGFSLAEISIPGVMGIDRIHEYAVYGLKPWLAILPYQFGLFAFQWAVGIFRLQKGRDKRWLGWIVIPLATFFFVSLFVLSLPALSESFIRLRDVADLISSPLQAGFTGGNLVSTIVASAVFGLISFGLMILTSGSFSLSRAAQETREVEALATAAKYGITSYAEEIHTRRRLGVTRAPSRLPALLGSGSLIWKDLLQARRTLRLNLILNWFSLFFLSVGISLLPDTGNLILAVAFWVIQAGSLSVVRLRNDLSLWPLARQMPISHQRFLMADLLPTFAILVLISLAGMLTGSIIATPPRPDLYLVIPGLAASIAGISAYDVIQRSRSNLLLVGSTPNVSARGILLGFLIAFVIVFAAVVIQGVPGLFLSVLLSLGIAWFVFGLAARSLINI